MAKIKYYAAQVAPEDQDPNFDRCNWWGWTVTGNRNYEGFMTAEYNLSLIHISEPTRH